MAHASTNPTWQDFPSTATLITAATLENIENTADTLYASEYGLGRTGRVVLRSYYTGTYLQTATDLFQGAGWTADIDPAGGFTAGSPCFYTIPISGRLWDVCFKTCTGSIASGTGFACKITLNTAAVANSIGSDNTVGTGSEAEICAFTPCYPLSAGDKLYWSAWSSVNCNVGTIFGGTVPEFTVRDVGPA